MTRGPGIAILGAGPAGVGAAFRLHRTGRGRATVFEAREVVGGNAGSFELHGQRVDYGSHRLHPACDPGILADIEGLLGEGLLKRPRHGRIRLRGRWIHFPLKPVDLLLRADRAFAAGALRDAAARVVPRHRGRPGCEEESFATVLRRALGPTICEHFYFPYARKIWGLPPEALSATQAHRRVAANSFGKLLRKVLGQLPGVKPIGFAHFYYPVRGYGAISEAYADAARQGGAEFRLGHRVTALERTADGWTVSAESAAGSTRESFDQVWSTIPISALARMTRPAPPAGVRAAAGGIRFRQMLLVYLTLDRDRYTEFDAHYFPGADVSMTRLSEPKNYAIDGEPRGRTTLCAELPCSEQDDVWSLSDEDLGRRVVADLEVAGLPDPKPLVGVHVRRLKYAYPIYEQGYDRHFEVLDAWASGLPDLLTFGRQGLFAHDNTHHALYMAYAAVECLEGERFDADRWAGYRREFETHVVED